mmetsp:Transcript_47921/g.159727  ORF Transcript_47921/g.159727 Transcript_47921/m.159727 type:complete len:494 (-) Transcript_47921:263-1744(-)
MAEEDLAPNGLPYSRLPRSSNEWTGRSLLLASLPADIVGTVHPHIVCRPRSEVGGGLGLFATYGLRKGEVVWAERARAGPDVQATPRTRAWIEALPEKSRRAYCHFMYKTGDDEYQSLAEFNELPIEEYPTVRTVDVSNYMNHSCDPTCWFVDGGAEYNGVMVASRDITPGEEITFDYATSEDSILTPEFDCQCGTACCRSRVSPLDWSLPAVAERYCGHFMPHIAVRIAQAEGHAEPHPLEWMEPEDVRRTWWLRLDTPSPTGPSLDTPWTDRPDPRALSRLCAERRELLSCAAKGLQLELLNRQAAVLISHHRLSVVCDEELRGSPRVDGVEDEGRYVKLGVPLDEGALVLLLPPNLLLWEEEVGDFNTCIQISPSTPHGPRLFSSSLTPHDLDNFLCHSCDPNCDVVVGPDLCVGFVARRPLAAGESLTFDYDSTEDDLTGDRGGFECFCGAPLCRGLILGKLHSPAAGAAKRLGSPLLPPPRDSSPAAP